MAEKPLCLHCKSKTGQPNLLLNLHSLPHLTTTCRLQWTPSREAHLTTFVHSLNIRTVDALSQFADSIQLDNLDIGNNQNTGSKCGLGFDNGGRDEDRDAQAACSQLIRSVLDIPAEGDARWNTTAVKGTPLKSRKGKGASSSSSCAANGEEKISLQEWCWTKCVAKMRRGQWLEKTWGLLSEEGSRRGGIVEVEDWEDDGEDGHEDEEDEDEDVESDLDADIQKWKSSKEFVARASSHEIPGHFSPDVTNNDVTAYTDDDEAFSAHSHATLPLQGLFESKPASLLDDMFRTADELNNLQKKQEIEIAADEHRLAKLKQEIKTKEKILSEREERIEVVTTELDQLEKKLRSKREEGRELWRSLKDEARKVYEDALAYWKGVKEASRNLMEFAAVHRVIIAGEGDRRAALDGNAESKMSTDIDVGTADKALERLGRLVQAVGSEDDI